MWDGAVVGDMYGCRHTSLNLDGHRGAFDYLLGGKGYSLGKKLVSGEW